MKSPEISLKTKVAYPRKATAGSTYLVSIDLDHAVLPEGWPYDDEEYPVTCILDSAPFFDQEAEGDSTIIVHRFGGSYGPARFWVTARQPPVPRAKGPVYKPRIDLTLINGAGVPIYSKTFDDIEITPGEGGYKVVPKPPADTPKPTKRVTRVAEQKQGTFRWLHLGDLNFGRVGEESRPDITPAVIEWMLRTEKSIDVVIVSGDVATDGRVEEYKLASIYLDELRRSIGARQGFHPRLIVVPGNHDQERSPRANLPVSQTWSFSSPQRREFWSNPAARAGVEKAFSAFADWSFRAETLGANSGGLLPGDFAAHLEINGLRVGIVGLNDSILVRPHGDVRADLHPEQLRRACGQLDRWASQFDLRILVTHHEPSSLPPEIGRNFYRDFAPRALFDLHLFGSTKFRGRKVTIEKVERATTAAINAIRLNGAAPQGFRIGEAQVTDGAVSVRDWALHADGAKSKFREERTLPIRLGRRPSGPIQSEMPGEGEASRIWEVVKEPLLSKLPVRNRHAIVFGLRQPRLRRLRLETDDLSQALMAAGYRAIHTLTKRATTRDSIKVLREVFKECKPQDLCLFLAGGLESPIDIRVLFIEAEKMKRRLLVVGDVIRTDVMLPPGCGVIGNLGFGEPGQIAPASHHALKAAFRTVTNEPMTTLQMARLIDGTKVSTQRGDFAISLNFRLTEEMAELIVAVPKAVADAEPANKKGGIGFDTAFLANFPVNLPRVTAQNVPPAPLLGYQHFSLLPNLQRRMAWFGAVNADFKRRNITFDNIDYEQFRYDKSLIKKDQLNEKIFVRGPFDRSRIVKKTLPSWGTDAQVRRAYAATGYFTNLMPLTPLSNRNLLWINLPDFILENYAKDQRMSVLSGPWFSADDPVFRDVQIPAACWRVFAFNDYNGQRVVAAFLTFQVAGAGKHGEEVPRFPRKLPEAPLVTRVPLGTLALVTGLDFGDLADHDIFAFEAPFPSGNSIPGEQVTSLDGLFPTSVRRRPFA